MIIDDRLKILIVYSPENRELTVFQSRYSSFLYNINKKHFRLNADNVENDTEQKNNEHDLKLGSFYREICRSTLAC